MSTETSYDTLFGRMAVDQGLCTDEELRKAIQECKERRKTDPLMLQDLMVQLGYLTASQAERLKTSVKESKVAATQIPGYKILGKLGAGAMAVVYKGKQLSLNRSVAIKVLPRRFSENPEYVQRFYKEGQAAGKLNHPNIVQAIDVGEAGGYHYFVMEYVEGKTIADDISNGHIFGEQEAIEIIIQVCHALQHAHAHGLVHRDVKPKNIMLTRDSTAKLADMGLARETADMKAAMAEAGRAYGTPYYISPEQIRGELNVDFRADMYSLGATFYHMVTGKVPFEGTTPASVMHKHLKEPLVPPDHVVPTLSSGIGEVIERMMAKKREQRYASWSDLLVDLEAVAQGDPPLMARKNYDKSLLQSLADSAANAAPPKPQPKPAPQPIKVPLLWLFIIGGLAALSIMINIIQLIT